MSPYKVADFPWHQFIDTVYHNVVDCVNSQLFFQPWGVPVIGKEFALIRTTLGRTQEQLARLLGLSAKAVQSIEQGWRNISVQTERHLLFLLFLKVSSADNPLPCWQKRKCPPETRHGCPAWEFKAGHLCWFVNGTICGGKPQESWKKKMAICRQCDVFPLKKYLLK